MPAPSFDELDTAAGADMPEISHASISVIGGLGIWNYLRGYQSTEVAPFLPASRFLVNSFASGPRISPNCFQGAPKAIKDELLAIPSTPFQQQTQQFFYKGPGGKSIQTDIIQDWMSPYVSSMALSILAL
ncbi:hypothetical protein N7532_005298 [Penicillium argentinense]|uniref:Uncharacterized protein n=1 Tax=Penicillium argentinense TaxID=1131581 RepID=A0A9W9KAS6_9EURO|nr:uncharacterized protein N7532_005298 [Penicillium argentinense]KAJ5098297.1 hypothetical protein N7532_005298 [Penicillium argentinense]